MQGLSARAILGLVVGCLVMLISGTLYAWNSFEGGLEKELGYNKSELNIISSVANVFNLVAFPAGWIFDRHGPVRVVLVGCILTVTGWTLLYLLASGHLASNYIWFMVFYAIVGHGVIWLYMASLLTSVRNFTSEHRGTIVGLLDACFGASAALFSAVYSGFFEGEPVSTFFVFGAIVTVIFGGLVPLCLMRVHAAQPSFPAAEEGETTVLALSAEEAAIAKLHGVQHSQYGATGAGMGDSLDPKFRRILNEQEGVRHNYQRHLDEAAADIEGQPETGAEASTAGSHGSELDIGGWAVLKHPHFLLMFPAFAVTLGGGTAFLNVISQALRENGKESLITTMTLVIPIMGTVMRFFAGLASDYLIRWVPRVFWVVAFIGMFILSEALFLAAWENNTALYIAGALSGCAFGGMWCVSPTLLSEEFGVTHFGFNWGIALVVCVIGTVIYGNVSPHISTPTFFLSLLIGNVLSFVSVLYLGLKDACSRKASA